jgi:hypothetical protein
MFQASGVQRAGGCITEMGRTKGAERVDIGSLFLANIPDVLGIYFFDYFKNGSRKDAQDNGLFIYDLSA